MKLEFPTGLVEIGGKVKNLWSYVACWLCSGEVGMLAGTKSRFFKVFTGSVHGQSTWIF